MARLARIWPLHLTTLALWLIIVPRSSWFIPGAQPHGFNIALANVFLLQAWIPIFGVYFSFNAVSWSISTEMFFYILFPWLGKDWEKTWLRKSVIISICVFIILAIGNLLHVPPLNFNSNDYQMSLTTHGIAYISPFVRIYEFVIGMCAALIFRRIEPHTDKVPGSIWGMLEILLVLEMGHTWAGGRHLSLAMFGSRETVAGFFVQSAPMAFLFAMIIVVYAIKKGLLSKLLSCKPLIILGEASFSLYLTHQMLLYPFQTHRAALSSIPVIIQFGIFFIFAIVASLILHYGVEKPCQRFIINRFSRGHIQQNILSNHVTFNRVSME